jgi:polyene glycosyltransferase
MTMEGTRVSTAAVNSGRRILFASEPAWGHINPLISIAGELAARGVQDIWFLSTGDRKAAIEAIPGGDPVRFASLGPGRPELEPENWPEATLRAMTTPSLLRNFAAVIDATYDQADTHEKYLRALAVVDELQPALAIIDLSATWAIDAVAKRGVPYLIVASMPLSRAYADRLPWSYPTPNSGLPGKMDRGQKVRNVLYRLGFLAIFFRPKHMRANLNMGRIRRMERLANPDMTASRYADRAVAVLAQSVPGIDYPFPRVPENVRMVGAIIPRDVGTTVKDEELARWLDASESVVYAAFGTLMQPTPEQVRAMLDATARLGPEHHVLWKLPRSRRHLLPGTLPPNLRIESWIPSQHAVLAHPHVRVFFNHGGCNAVHEGLYFGKPLLVMPFWMDNLDAAARVADSGAGLAVPRAHHPDANDISARLTRLLGEPAFRLSAEHWSRELRAAGGVVAAADEITAALDQLAGASTQPARP